MKDRQSIFDVRNVTKFYRSRGWFPWAKDKSSVVALNNVSLQIESGEILGLAGESGSGKTTLAEILAGLQPLTSGSVFYQGKEMAAMNKLDWKEFRREVQVVFQDPYESLNPRHTVQRTVFEPLYNVGIRSRSETMPLIKQALTHAGLKPASSFLTVYPHQLSGGQRQRVAIARAIVLSPKVLIADEPVSMLDVSLRASILTLLKNLRDTMGLTIVYISHDLNTVGYLCDRIAILHLGVLKEIDNAAAVFASPRDPYTRQLLEARPTLASANRE